MPVYGGAINNSFETFLENELKNRPGGFSEDTIRHLVQTYGSEYGEILQYCDRDQKWSKTLSSNSPVIRAQILHGIREEMACTLEDLLYRRTHLGVVDYPDESSVSACAEIMAQELDFHGEKNDALQCRPEKYVFLDPNDILD
jgi:glycerol-3-phosphate dehydrogenase